MSVFRRSLLMYQTLNRIPKPIASYRCYDKTNDDEDRDVLKDLTGNGHDIQLYNFAFAESSGYGKYATDFRKFRLYNFGDTQGIGNYRGEVSASNSIIHITYIYTTNNAIAEYVNNIKFPSYRIKVTGLNGKILRYRAEINATNVPLFDITEDGIYTLPAATIETQYQSSFFITTNGECDITIEQIPDYQGALVSDGVDDYGLCENFPILSPEKGFTICVIREKLLKKNNRYDCIYYIGNNDSNFPIISRLSYVSYTELDNKAQVSSFNKLVVIYDDKAGFNYQTSLKYNGYNLNKGTESGGGRFTLFCQGLESGKHSDYSNTAIYALEIYDRDLTDKEIATVKARMIAEYEAKTGNVSQILYMEDGSEFLMEDDNSFIIEGNDIR